MHDTWKRKMIEQRLDYAGCTIKEMTNLYEFKVKSLEPKEGKWKITKNQEQTSKKKKIGKKET